MTIRSERNAPDDWRGLGPEGSRPRTVFETLAWLFAPEDDASGCALIEAGRDWRLALPAGYRSVVWGRLPAQPQPLHRLVSTAIARERALVAVRPGAAGLRCWGVHRLPTLARRPGPRGSMRSGLLGGAIVRLGRGPAPRRVADAVAASAGHADGPLELRASGDGSALASMPRPGSPAAILRLATTGGLKDVARNRDALLRLGEGGTLHTPRLLDAGTTLGVGWTVEARVPGTPVGALSEQLLDDVVAWAATLPRSGGSVSAVEERLELIMRAFPATRDHIGTVVGLARERARDVPAILEHGDFWTGNLLADGGRMSGVVDWDNWHPAGVPGSDLLHLVAMAGRGPGRVDLGELWLDQPWTWPAYRSASGPYFERLGLTPTDDVAWLVGLSWWAAYVTASLRRGRQPATDPRWVARNVENVALRLTSAI